MDELLWPDKAFQKEMAGILFQLGFRSQRRWHQKPIEAQQWKMAPLAFSYSLYTFVEKASRERECEVSWLSS